MKKLFSAGSVILLLLINKNVNAQAFEKNNILLSMGIGAIDDLTAYSSGEHAFSPPNHFTFYPVRPQFFLKAEFAPHKYWGVGFIASVDGRANMNYTYSPGVTGRVSEFNTQLALLVNYHFYQLIADKLGRGPKLHADKLDIYTGFTIGAGMNLYSTEGVGHQNPYFSPVMGLHLGVRYYFTQSLSMYGEFGIGQSYFNIGITYKFGMHKKQKPIKEF